MKHEYDSYLQLKFMCIVHTKHVDCKDKPITFLKCKCDQLKYSQTNLTSLIKGENGNVCETSYTVSCHTAHCSEACVIYGNLIMPCVVDSFMCLLIII
jgi:hypothetical protein